MSKVPVKIMCKKLSCLCGEAPHLYFGAVNIHGDWSDTRFCIPGYFVSLIIYLGKSGFFEVRALWSQIRSRNCSSEATPWKALNEPTLLSVASLLSILSIGLYY